MSPTAVGMFLKQARGIHLTAWGCLRCPAPYFSWKRLLQHERSAGKQRAPGREVTSSSWSRRVTCWMTEQLGSSLLCYYFGNFNKQKRPDQSLSAPAQTLRSPVDFGGNGSLRHQFLHVHCASFGPWAKLSEIATENIISSPLISRCQLLCWRKLAPRNWCSFVPWRTWLFNFCVGAFKQLEKSMDVYIFKQGLFLPLSIINGSQVRLRNNARDKLPCMLFIYDLPTCFLLN